jgi:hypothetical protein
MNYRITTHGSQRGHVKGAANILSAAEYTRPAGEPPGDKVVRGDANEGCYLLTIKLSQLGQLSQESRTGMRADTCGAAENFIFFAEVIVGFDVLFDEFVKLGDLVIEGFEHFADAFTNLGVKYELTSVRLLHTQVSKLSTAPHQVGQLVDFGAGRRFWIWLNDLSEAGKDIRVDGVGLGPFAEASCEIADLSWGSNDNLKVCHKQFGDDGTLVSAGCFEDDQCNFVRLKDFDELLCARGIVGQRNVDRGGTRGDVKCVFGNVDADEERFIHGFLPILQMRTRRSCCLRQEDAGAVPAAVRVSPTVAARITLRDGLEGLGTLDLSSPASCGSARYTRLTARRIYYGTFNHDICQHTRHEGHRGYSLMIDGYRFEVSPLLPVKQTTARG